MQTFTGGGTVSWNESGGVFIKPKEAKPMKQIRVTECVCNSNFNDNPCETCYGVWRKFIKDSFGIFYIDGGCEVHKNNVSKYDIRDAPEGKSFTIPILEQKEVSEVLAIYRVIAWHKDKDGNRAGLAYDNEHQGEGDENIKVKAMLDEDNWAGGTHSDPDAFIWQVIEVK